MCALFDFRMSKLSVVMLLRSALLVCKPLDLIKQRLRQDGERSFIMRYLASCDCYLN